MKSFFNLVQIVHFPPSLSGRDPGVNYGGPIRPMLPLYVPILFVSFLLPSNEAWAMDRAPQATKPVVGWLEQVRISPPGLLLEAKLDTGADVSSLHATQMTEFSKEGRPWVRFTITDRKGDQAILEEVLGRVITITRHGGREEKRPVVRLNLCLGNIFKTVEISLVDRTGLKFPLLIGRNFMADVVLLDPSLEFTSTPHCESVRPQ